MPTFDTPTAITASIDIVAGDILVVAGDRTDTVVEVRARNGSDQLDATTAAQTRVAYTDGRLTITSPKPPQLPFTRAVTCIDVTVELPTGSHVHGTTAHGNVRGEGRLGDCDLRTYHGDIGLQRTGSLRATTTSGRITVARVHGDAHVTGCGDVRLPDVGGAAYIKNMNGPTWIGQAAGDVHVNSANGDISIDRAGPQVLARTAHGRVRLGEVARGSATLQTASGGIEVGIRHGTVAWLDAKSSAGTIHNDLEVTGGPEGPRETAEIHARTWDGDIVVARAA